MVRQTGCCSCTFSPSSNFSLLYFFLNICVDIRLNIFFFFFLSLITLTLAILDKVSKVVKDICIAFICTIVIRLLFTVSATSLALSRRCISIFTTKKIEKVKAIMPAKVYGSHTVTWSNIGVTNDMIILMILWTRRAPGPIVR